MPDVSMPLDPQLSLRARTALRIAHETGAMLLDYAGRLEGFDTKASSFDLVTAADRAAEAAIIDALRASHPADAIVAEESDGREGALARRDAILDAELAWCIDPVDGTTNFVHRYPAYSISIGLLARGVPVLGVVHAPARGETFTGGRGWAPALNGAPIAVSRTNSVHHALIGTGFPARRLEVLDETLARLGRVLRVVHGVRRAGSAALDMCDVAVGRLDGYYERGLSPWDLAAGQAIVEAAGGRVTDEAGGPHDLWGGSVLATNGLIHEALGAVLAGVPGEG